MKHDINTLVTDICTSYPELAREVDFVRSLVTELVAKQPTVDINEDFKTLLRTELILRANSQSKPKLAIPWWFIYTVPVGVTAILLLVVYPNMATAPQPLMPTGTMSPESSMMKMGGEESVDMMSIDMQMNSDEAGTAAVASDYFTATFMPDKQTIKVSYITLSQPGFVVVSGPEGVMATSALILPGDHVDIIIPVALPVQSGVTYNATLHFDNGDDVFMEDNDFMTYDQFGQPIMMPIVAP